MTQRKLKSAIKGKYQRDKTLMGTRPPKTAPGGARDISGCPDCGHRWEDHEFGVPSPFCPPKSELAPVSGSVTGARDQQWIQEMCELVKNKMPKGYGFVVFGFPFNSAGRLYYASNGQREDVIKSLKEWIKHAEADFLKHK